MRIQRALASECDPESLLTWFERVLRTLRECPEVGENSCAGSTLGIRRVSLTSSGDSTVCDFPRALSSAVI